MRFSYLVPYSTLIPKGMCDQFGTKKSQSHAASRQQTATIEKRKPRQPARRKARNKHRKVTKETRGEDGKTKGSHHAQEETAKSMDKKETKKAATYGKGSRQKKNGHHQRRAKRKESHKGDK